MEETPQIRLEDFVRWLQSFPPEASVGDTELLTENTPLCRFLKGKFAVQAVYLGPSSWLWQGKFVDLPDWAVRFEALIAQLPRNIPVTQTQAWALFTQAFWEPYLRGKKKEGGSRVESE